MKHFVAVFFISLLTSFAFGQKKSEKGYYEQALRKMEMENFEGALADLDNAIRADSTHADAFFQRGFINALLLHHQKALADFDKAILLNPSRAQYYSERGIARLNLNDKEGGCADLKKAASMGDEAAKEMAHENCP